MTKIAVALVGREQPGDENLALRYLAAALTGADHRPFLVPLSGPDELEDAVRTVLARRPGIVGVSIPDADIAVDALAFVRLLRARGYTGHVTCGGALATLVRGEILAKHPGFDSVVRHDGEVPIVALADRIGGRRPVDGVPGLTTRSGDGAPSPVTDPAPLSLRPLRDERLPRILGVPVARMLASRGCPGRCPYCGPAALQRAAVDEGLRAGSDHRTLARLGVGGTRRRSPDDVADEIADLYHDKGARLFHLLDDNLLAGDAGAAARWLTRLTAEMARRRVGRTAFSLQMDPLLVTGETAEALVELGAIRVLLGVEALTPEGLRALGRKGVAEQNRRALERLRDRGVVTLFNSLLVHPQATVESITAEIDALAHISGVHFDALSMAVYPGTDAWRRLCETGEATGGMLGWRFQPRDPVVARFRALLVRLRLTATGRYGANVFAHDVAVNLAMARRLGLDAYDARHEQTLAHAIDELGEARIRAWRAALALSSAEMPAAARAQATAALVSGLSRELADVSTRIEAVQRALERAARVQPGSPGNLLVRSALAAGFTLLLAPHPACDCGFGSHTRDAGADARTVRDAGPGLDSAMDAMPVDAAPDTGIDAPFVPDTAIDGPLPDAGCTPEQQSMERVRASTRLREIPCPPCAEDMTTAYGILLDDDGKVVDVRRNDGMPVPDTVRDCYLTALSGETFPCLAGDEVWQECVICLF